MFGIAREELVGGTSLDDHAGHVVGSDIVQFTCHVLPFGDNGIRNLAFAVPVQIRYCLTVLHCLFSQARDDLSHGCDDQKTRDGVCRRFEEQVRQLPT